MFCAAVILVPIFGFAGFLISGIFFNPPYQYYCTGLAIIAALVAAAIIQKEVNEERKERSEKQKRDFGL